jgi:hypothetical protein
MGSNEEKIKGGDLFRKKSLDRIASPEALTDYLKVTTPANWMILGSIVVMLLGIIVWAFLGNLNTFVSGDAVAEGGHIAALVIDDDAQYIKEGQTIMIGDWSSQVGEVTVDEFGRTKVEASMDVPDGEYRAKIVIEQITPFELLFN